MQAILEFAGCSRVGMQWMQAVPECTGSGCRQFQSVQEVGTGWSRVCKQWVLAVPECARFSKMQQVGPKISQKNEVLTFFTQILFFEKKYLLPRFANLLLDSMNHI